MFDSWPDWYLCVPYECSLSLLGYGKSFCKGFFFAPVFSLAECARLNVFHDKNPCISVKKNLRIPIFTFWPTWVLQLSYKLWDFQFLVYIWGLCFSFNTVKTCGFIFCLFCFKCRPVCLPFYRRNFCYFWCKIRVSKCPCFLLRIFLSLCTYQRLPLCSVIHSSAFLYFEENVLGWILNYLCP